MGWNIDSLCWDEIRDRILKDRYAGCVYSIATSFSPVIIRYRGEITKEERQEMVDLFPDMIRVEFQRVYVPPHQIS